MSSKRFSDPSNWSMLSGSRTVGVKPFRVTSLGFGPIRENTLIQLLRLFIADLGRPVFNLNKCSELGQATFPPAPASRLISHNPIPAILYISWQFDNRDYAHLCRINSRAIDKAYLKG